MPGTRLPPARKPRGMRGRLLDLREVRHGRGPKSTVTATSGSCSQAAVLGQAEEDVERLDGLARRALDEVVEDADGEHAARSLVAAHVDAEPVAAGDVLGRRRRRHDLDEALAGVRLGVQRVELGLVVGRVGRTWQAARMPRVIGIRWGRKSTGSSRAAAPASPSSCSISATWRWPPTP